MTIKGNDVLESISGLSNLNSVGNKLYIGENNQLYSCCNVLGFSNMILNRTTIENNTTGCNSLLEIDTSCADCDEENGITLAIWYADFDGDGLGDPDSLTISCVKPEDYVLNNSDEFPNCVGEEDECGICNGSGIAQGTCDCAGNPPTNWYIDSDNDGLGNINNYVATCVAPEGYVGNSNDEDDNMPYCNTIFYDSTIECPDEVDGDFYIHFALADGDYSYFSFNFFYQYYGDFTNTFSVGPYPNGTADVIYIIDHTNSCFLVFSANVECTVTAIDLLSFEVAELDRLNKVMWSTASEADNDYFTVNKSYNGVDFEIIEKISSLGNSSSIVNYYFEDYNIRNGKTFYRIDFTDFHGNTESSDVIQINRNNKNQSISLSPNPATDFLELEFDYHEIAELTMKIFDVKGKVILQEKFATQIGMNNNKVDVSTFESGLYFIQLYTNNFTKQSSFIIN